MKKKIKTPYKQYLINNPNASIEKIAKFFGKTRIEDIAAIKMVLTKFLNEIKKNTSKKILTKTIKKSIPFKNETGFRKKMFRERKVNLVKKSGIINGEYLHLPSQTCADVILLNKRISNNKFKYVGCENNKNALNNMYKNLYKNNLLMDVSICNIRDKIVESKSGRYSHIDFDYCGTVSKYFEDVVLAMNKKVVKVGGLIFVSFNMRDSKCSTPNQLKSLIKRHCGINYKLIDDEVLWYSDSKRSANKYMTASIKRIK